MGTFEDGLRERAAESARQQAAEQRTRDAYVGGQLGYSRHHMGLSVHDQVVYSSAAASAAGSSSATGGGSSSGFLGSSPSGGRNGGGEVENWFDTAIGKWVGGVLGGLFVIGMISQMIHVKPNQSSDNQASVPTATPAHVAPSLPDHITLGKRHSLELNTLLHDVYISDNDTYLRLRLFGVQPTDVINTYTPWVEWNAAFKNAAYPVACTYRDHGAYQCFLLATDGKTYDVALWALDQGVITSRGVDAPDGYLDQAKIAYQNHRGNWR